VARGLHSVPPGRTPPRTRKLKASPKTVTVAAESGTTRELMVAMRARIATAVEDPNTAARDLAALTKRLVEVVRDIEAIDAREAQGGDAANAPDEAFDASAI
jgi:ribosome-binding protein aMBF1 (putative translation factor)